MNFRSVLRINPLGGLLILVLLLLGWSAGGSGVVTNCSEASLRSALAGGGAVVFGSDCSITLAAPIVIGPGTTTIDAAGHNVTLSGNNSIALLRVNGALTLIGLKLTNGKGTNGGALYINPGSVVVATNCTFSGNSAVGVTGAAGYTGADSNSGKGSDGGPGSAGSTGQGGAIFNAGILSLLDCTLSTNTATGGNGGSGGNGGAGGGTLSQGGNGGSGGNGGAAYGGAVYNYSNLTIVSCTFNGNTADGGNGGAGGTNGTGLFTSLMGNGGGGGPGSGGAVFNVRNLNLRMSCFSGNLAFGGNSAAGGTQSSGTGSNGMPGADGAGGGLWSAWWGIVTNCTFFANGAIGGNGGNGGPGGGTFGIAGAGGNGGNAWGGGLLNSGTLTVVNCTLASCGAWGGTNGVAGSGNYTNSGGSMGQGLGGDLANSTGTFTLMNSLLSTNITGGNGYGTIIDAGYNLSSDGSLAFTGTGSRANTDPKLGALSSNGGLTQTMPLLSGSPAINQIPAYRAPATDQRGYPRPLPPGGLADIGAYEYQLASPPVFVVAPKNQTVLQGNSATFAALAVGAIPLTYQWRFNSSPIPGATGTSYTVTAASPTNEGPYAVVVANSLGTATSPDVFISLAPAITSQPTNQVVPAGGTATFTAQASGDPPTYNWQFGGSNISGATNATLIITNAQPANIGTYKAIISNDSGTTNSAPVTLNLLPTVQVQPLDQTVMSGSNASFTVGAVGSPALSFQWQFNGNALAGATNSAYTLAPATLTNSGLYSAVLQNPFGQTNTRQARLTVIPAGFTISGQISNLFVPAQVLVLQGAVTNQIVTTDISGNYTATGLAAGNYTVQPLALCRHFVPVALPVTVGPTNATGVNFSPLADAYVVSGRFTSATVGVSNLVLTLSPVGGAALTGPDGSYAFSNLCAGTYTINVSAGTCYQITPASRVATVGPNDALNQDFSITQLVYSVSGLITEGASGLGGVVLQVSGQTNTAVTLADGSYSLTGLCQGTYNLIPVLHCEQFSPASRSILVGPSLTQVNFTAYTNDVFNISGQVTTNGVNGLPGVTIIAGDRTATTDSNGYYALSHICPGTNQVVPALAGYGFSPAGSNLTVAADVNGVNFLAYPSFTIAGRITDLGTGLSNVPVQINGGRTNVTVLTTNDGTYSISGLSSNLYTVTPALACYFFAPTNQGVQVGPTNALGVDFTATHDNIHLLSGQITEGGVGLSNITVVVSAAGFTNTLLTDANGAYALPNLCSAVYTVVPTQACQSFFPVSHVVTLTPTGPDATSTDFSGYRNSFTVRGQVTAAPSGRPLAGVPVSIANQTSLTDGDGNYVLVDLCPGLYQVQARLAGYRFDWRVSTLNLVADTTLNFTAYPVLALTRTNGLAQLSFGVASGLAYRLEVSSDLVHWQDLMMTNNGSASMTLLQLIDNDSSSYPARFYRLAELPWLVLNHGTNGVLQLSFVGYGGVSYQLQASTNLLASTNWQTIAVLTNISSGAAQIEFTDPAATNYPARFYRLH